MIDRAIVTSAKLQTVRAYFQAHDFDPSLVAPDFFMFHLRHGLSPQQIYAVATRVVSTSADHVTGKAH